MRIAIIGTRGIPNNYGGFEQFAECLAKELAAKAHQVTVYNSHNHSFQDSNWNKVTIIHRFDPEYLLGTVGQFVYDFNCIRDTRRNKFDIILQLGYTSSTVWSFLFPKKSIIITNMDGLEWSRAKYSSVVKKFLKYAEQLGVQHSHYLVADSIGIKEYLKKEYQVTAEFIPYGAEPFSGVDENILTNYQLNKSGYDLLIARMEPENNIETILDGVVQSEINRVFLVIGNTENRYGERMRNKFSGSENIRFLGPIYNFHTLSNLRYFSNLYFHGHSVGGTNPSLLEAMASSALICAHRNIFNLAILEEDAYFFETADEVAKILRKVVRDDSDREKIQANLTKITNIYSWKNVINQYEKLFISTLSTPKIVD